MKNAPTSEPDLLEELEAEASDLVELPLEAVAELARNDSPPAGARERLLGEVSELPLRYAPFFERLGALWDLTEEQVRAELERSKDREEWRFTALPGIRLFDVRGGERTKNAEARLVHFSPGFRFPVHRHTGHEQVFILEGSYTDSSGAVYRSGDLHVMTEDSEHGFVVDEKEPCIAAVVEQGREFRSVFLRVLSKFVRDG
ncbi:MAG TPA: cupin domain-containing protein [Polyangiaceae bacterium]